MTQARQYGQTNDELFKQSEAQNATTEDKAPQKVLYITVSSDKGLCGGVHSGLSRYTRSMIEKAPSDQETTVIIVGDKSKGQLSRLVPEKIALSFNQVGKDVPTFAEAQTIADQIFALEDLEFDRVEVVYNVFKSMITYEPGFTTVFSEEALKLSRMEIPYSTSEAG